MVRLKSRYAIVRLRYKDGRVAEPTTEAGLLLPLRVAVAAAFGDAGAAAAAGGALAVRWLDPVSGVAVVRCGRSELAQVRGRGDEARGRGPGAAAPSPPHPASQLHAVIALLTDIHHRAVVAHTVRVCGRAAAARRAARAEAARGPAPVGRAQEKMREDALKRLVALDV